MYRLHAVVYVIAVAGIQTPFFAILSVLYYLQATISITKLVMIPLHQELMSHPKGGEGASNTVEMALAKVLKCCDQHFYGMGGPTYDITQW